MQGRMQQRRGGPAERSAYRWSWRPACLEPLEPRTLLSATLSAEFVAVNNTAVLTGYTTADLQVTSTTDWTSAALRLELTTGSIYQDAQGDVTAPNPAQFVTYPALRFDTYLDADGNAVFVAGGAIDVGGDVFAFDTTQVDALWFDLATDDTGALTLGRFTLTDDAAGTWSMRLLNAAGDVFTDTGSFTQGQLAPPTPVASATEADLTGDGKADLLWRNLANGANTVWAMDGTTFQANTALKAMPDLDWHLAGIADFTGDGKNDLLWRNSNDGENIVWEVDGTDFQLATPIKSMPNLTWQVVGVGDFTGDGWTDILWRNSRTGKNTVWEMLGTTFQNATAIKRLRSTDWWAVGVSDFTGDDQPDILWRSFSTGANTVWAMDGTAYQTGIAIKPLTNFKWNAASVADFTGDGKTDILWRNSKNGRNTVWAMDGTTFQAGIAIKRLANKKWQTGAQAAAGTASLTAKLTSTRTTLLTRTAYTPIGLSEDEHRPLFGLWEPDDA